MRPARPSPDRALRSRFRLRRAALPCLLMLGLAACASGRGIPETAPGTRSGDAHPGLVNLDATLWMQTAAEYEAAARQAYHAAAAALPALRADSSHTALPSQRRRPGYRALPPAVVLDVDETVLDNSPYQARLVLAGRAFSPESWAEWVREAKAAPVPGAVEFVRAARSSGVDVYYVTNRDHRLEPATRRNLRRAGFPLDAPGDAVLTEGEREGWGSDKADRRRAVAEGHRILMLAGDDLNDFVSGADTMPVARRALARQHRGRWGRSWIVLPNPAYGSWERAAYGFEGGLSPAEKEARKLEALDPKREPERR